MRQYVKVIFVCVGGGVVINQGLIPAYLVFLHVGKFENHCFERWLSTQKILGISGLPVPRQVDMNKRYPQVKVSGCIQYLITGRNPERCSRNFTCGFFFFFSGIDLCLRNILSMLKMVLM